MNQSAMEKTLPSRAESAANSKSNPTMGNFPNFPEFDLGAQLSVAFTPAGALVYRWRTHCYEF